MEKSHQWFERACRVIPGGIYGHTSPVMTVPVEFPYYAVSASGCRYTDVDGRTYIDFLCGYGPVVLGHARAEVDEAAEAAVRSGSCLNHPTPHMVELAERLVALIDGMDWAVFGKNGSDMTTWALRVAREHTGKRRVLMVRGAYHGTHAWCSPGHGGLVPDDRAAVSLFNWNDPEGLERAAGREGDVAAVILTPFHHPAFGDNADPSPAFMEAVHAFCRKHGALLILDDVRAGFRLDLRGSHRHYGWQPDLSCYCKAMANGHPISAALGRDELKAAASRVFLTGSYWNNPAPMAACLRTLELLEKENAIAQMEVAGRRLVEGLVALGARHGHPMVASGPMALPYVRFVDDPGFHRMQSFCSEAVRQGVFLHPHHNWFVCAAHRPEDMDDALARLQRAFQVWDPARP